MADGEYFVYAVVGNIPNEYHSSDLRDYFSQFIESQGFECFHFRHRPENRIIESSVEKHELTITDCTTSNTNSTTQSTCCVVKLSDHKLDDLMRMYHRKHWLDRKGESIPKLCIISRCKVSQNEETTSEQYQTRKEVKTIPQDREDFTESDLQKLAELHPPAIMLNGNVGTSTAHFLNLIQQCRLPPVVIKKLGLTFPKTRSNKRYGNVPFDYHTKICERLVQENDIETVKTASGHELLAENEASDAVSSHEKTSSKMGKRWKRDAETRKLMNERVEEKMIEAERSPPSEEDNDTCEEWERHEALTDDPANQERNKERLFEEDIELKWEKGGSGLVFYTDAQFWHEKEGDFDEQTTDDLDVDMSIYYEAGAGDKDARDFIKMRQETRRRNGIEVTDSITSGIDKRHRDGPKSGDDTAIGKFEVHTKGFGRRILQRQGWKDGEGLGSMITGITDAIEGDGQGPRTKTGFGYRGEKLVRYGQSTAKHRRANRDVIISTKYDDPCDTDPTEPLYRRNGPYNLTYRDPVPFTKAADEGQS